MSAYCVTCQKRSVMLAAIRVKVIKVEEGSLMTPGYISNGRVS